MDSELNFNSINWKSKIEELDYNDRTKYFDPNLIIRTSQIELLKKFNYEKIRNPKLTQKQLCEKIGTSVSTLRRIRIDLDMKSFYRYNTPLKERVTKANAPKALVASADVPNASADVPTAQPKRSNRKKSIPKRGIPNISASGLVSPLAAVSLADTVVDGGGPSAAAPVEAIADTPDELITVVDEGGPSAIADEAIANEVIAVVDRGVTPVAPLLVTDTTDTAELQEPEIKYHSAINVLTNYFQSG